MLKVLECSGVGRDFGRRVAVERIDLDVAPGEVHALLGPNGAGKTTTMRMLLGHLRPSRGRITLLGQPLTQGAPALGETGALVEGPAFYPWLSARANLEIALASRGVPRRERRALVVRAAARVELAGDLDRRYAEYSTGMARRLGIAAAIAHDPKLIVLDEPTSGLDPLAIASLVELLRGLARDGGAGILISSHVLGDVEAIADRVTLLVKGVVARGGKLTEMLAGAAEELEIEVQREREGIDVGAIIASVEGVTLLSAGATFRVRAAAQARLRLVRALVEAGAIPVMIRPVRRTLEEIFLQAARS